VRISTSLFNGHDLDGLAELLADDVVSQAPGGTGEGRAACIESYRSWFAAFPDAHLELHSAQMIDDLALVEGKFTGTHSGVARTGRSVALDYIQVLRFRDGRQVSSKLMFDRLLMLQELGLIPDAAPTR
jgi:ketosteroid isomerase-like protein